MEARYDMEKAVEISPYHSQLEGIIAGLKSRREGPR